MKQLPVLPAEPDTSVLDLMCQKRIHTNSVKGRVSFVCAFTLLEGVEYMVKLFDSGSRNRCIWTTNVISINNQEIGH